MKKYAFLLVAVIMALFTGCPQNVKFNPDLTKIKNFTNYSSIGVGTKDTGSARSVARAASNNETNVLIGLNKYTELIEELGFETTEGEVKEELYVCGYVDTEPFLFVCFDNNNSHGLQKFFPSGESITNVYAISKESGKIYDLDNRSFQHEIHNKKNVFVSCHWENEPLDSEYIYKLSEESELLKIEKYCRLELLDSDRNDLKTDIFGNLINIYNGKYLTNTRDMRSAYYDAWWFLGYDKKLYSRKDNDTYAWIDENGDIQDIAYNSDGYTIQHQDFSENELVYSEGLDCYYATSKEVWKITFENSEKVRAIKTKLKDISCKPVKYDSKIFFLNETNKVTCYDFANILEETINIPNFFADAINLTDAGIECSGFQGDNETKFLINTDSLEYSEFSSGLRKRSISSVVYLAPIN